MDVLPVKASSVAASADKMPAYIELCIGTWHRAFDGHEIVAINHGNLGQYVAPNTLPLDVLTRLPPLAVNLPTQ